VLQNQWQQSQNTVAASGELDTHSQPYSKTINHGNGDGNSITRVAEKGGWQCWLNCSSVMT